MKEKKLKIDAIQVGTTYKNFRVLSQALGFKEPPTSNSKKAVLRELDRYFEIKREGNAFTIESIREQPKEAVRRVGNNRKYIDSLHETLYKYATLNRPQGFGYKKYTFTNTFSSWLTCLGMATYEYNKFMNPQSHDDIVQKYMEDDKSPTAKINLYLFENETDHVLRNIFNTFLISEEKNKRIKFEGRYFIKIPTTTITKSDCIDSENYRTRFADAHEEKIINEAMEELMDKYGVDNIFKLGKKKRNFYRELEELIRERGRFECFHVIRITVLNLPEDIKDKSELELISKEFDSLVKNNLQMIKKTLLDSLPQRYERAVKKSEKEFEDYLDTLVIRPPHISKPDSIYVPPEDYVEKQTKFIEEYW